MAKLPKKPRRPRRSATLQTWERFDRRYNDWKNRVKEIERGHSKKEGLITKYQRTY